MAEYTAKCNAAINGKKEAPDCSGGFNFDPKREPHPDCPECAGNGVSNVVYTDTSKTNSPLYGGAKMGRNGPELILRDRDKALDNLAKYLGMFIVRTELTGKEGGSIDVHTTAEELTKEQLMQIARAGASDNTE